LYVTRGELPLRGAVYNPTGESTVRVSIHPDLYFLPDLDPAQLVFRHVNVQPEVAVVEQRDHLRPRTDQFALGEVATGHQAGGGRHEFRFGKIQLGQFQVAFALLDRRSETFESFSPRTRFEQGQTGTGRLQLRLRAFQLVAGNAALRLRGDEVALRQGPRIKKPAGAVARLPAACRGQEAGPIVSLQH